MSRHTLPVVDGGIHFPGTAVWLDPLRPKGVSPSFQFAIFGSPFLHAGNLQRAYCGTDSRPLHSKKSVSPVGHPPRPDRLVGQSFCYPLSLRNET